MKKVLDYVLPKLMQQAKVDQIERFVVAAVISKQAGKKILCLKRAGHDFMPGLYELPSGRVEGDETLLQALAREVKEETRLDNIEIVDYLSFFDYRSQSGKLTRQLNFIVQCDNTRALMIDENEHEGYTWLGIDEVEKYNISTETKRVIRGFFLRQGLATSPTQQMVNGWQQGIEEFVVGGVIGQNNKVLLLKRASDDFMGGIYELPSGKLEGGECVEMGVAREVEEETNLQVKALGRDLPHFDYRSSSGALTRQLNFSIQVNDANNIKLSSEHEGFAWAHEGELTLYPISKEVKGVVSEYLPKKPQTSLVAMNEFGVFGEKRNREEKSDHDDSTHKRANTLGDN